MARIYPSQLPTMDESPSSSRADYSSSMRSSPAYISPPLSMAAKTDARLKTKKGALEPEKPSTQEIADQSTPVPNGALSPENHNSQQLADDTDQKKASLKPNKQTIADDRKRRHDDQTKQTKDQEEKKRARTSHVKEDSEFYSHKLTGRRKKSPTPKRDDHSQPATRSGGHKEHPDRGKKHPRGRVDRPSEKTWTIAKKEEKRKR